MVHNSYQSAIAGKFSLSRCLHIDKEDYLDLIFANIKDKPIPSFRLDQIESDSGLSLIVDNRHMVSWKFLPLKRFPNHRELRQGNQINSGTIDYRISHGLGIVAPVCEE